MRRLTTVRYGRQNLRGLFTVETDEELKGGDTCVVRSARGTELGVVLAKPIEDGQGEAGCGESACGSCATSQGTVLRRATPEELQRALVHKKEGVMTEIRYARERSREQHLGMKIIGAEYLFEKEKLILHFSSNGRIEFHQFVRELAGKFSTRIELKPIGARDEARLVGDVASCGRELCCKSFLHDLQPVSMRMAKQQKKTLDPTKIAGQCGKLKCCLRYEDSVYVELQKTLPKRGAFVRIEHGLARVLNTDLLLQKLVVEMENGDRHVVHVSQLLEVGIKFPRPSLGGDPRAQAQGGVPGAGAPPAASPVAGGSAPPLRRVTPAKVVSPARVLPATPGATPAPGGPGGAANGAAGSQDDDEDGDQGPSDLEG